jgi:hypothetical protein
MLRMFAIVAAATTSSMLYCGGALALIAPLQQRMIGANSIVEPMTFWSHPYPYGYAWHRPRKSCVQHRSVDTPEGPRTERVWVCGPPLRSQN